MILDQILELHIIILMQLHPVQLLILITSISWYIVEILNPCDRKRLWKATGHLTLLKKDMFLITVIVNVLEFESFYAVIYRVPVETPRLYINLEKNASESVSQS